MELAEAEVIVVEPATRVCTEYRYAPRSYRGVTVERSVRRSVWQP